MNCFARALFFAWLGIVTVFSQAADTTAPVIVKVSPTPGRATNVARVTVSFSEGVLGVDANDLWMNGVPAVSVTNIAVTNYTFTFEPPLSGPAVMTWYAGHGIADLAAPPNLFDENAPNAIWDYQVADVIRPAVTAVNPPGNAKVRSLNQIEVLFSEPVTGVDASDLLVNGQSAREVTALSATDYLFQFDPVTQGQVPVRWVANPGITDLADPPNSFAPGASWTYTVDPNTPLEDVVINEFLVSNTNGLKDEEGDYEDWIELYNRGTTAVNLEGWALTDDPDEPAQWTFPAVNLGAKQYLIVFASGKDRKATTTGTRLHTNFKLSVYGEYLGLYSAESPRRVVSGIAPKYPPQRNNYSYGQDSNGEWRHFQKPTPGVANGDSTITNSVAEPHFSVTRGMFNQPFNLILTTPTPGATILYTTNGSEPTATNGIPYQAPILIRTTSTVRAAAFASNSLPSRTITHSYFMNLAAARL
ncbi:MAG TPA: lamin tail domain-containing protein, partial [Verrucomicrobiae bacterium]|nr:lamin tail domain-containing protein [Verrucomicrobiae bacterium]